MDMAAVDECMTGEGTMIWLLTIPVGVVAAYAVLCLLIDTGKGSSSCIPYWLLLLASTAILYVAWCHPVRISFA